MALTLDWIQCKGDVWCGLSRVNLSSVTSTGVYIIWKPSNPPRVIRVGQGDITSRLSAHRNDHEIMQHGDDLLVTWAQVPSLSLDGVERYLAERLQPTVGDRFPDALPIEVNIP